VLGARNRVLGLADRMLPAEAGHMLVEGIAS